MIQDLVHLGSHSNRATGDKVTIGDNVYVGPNVTLDACTLESFAYVGMGFFLGARFARRSEEVVVALSAIGVPLLVLGGTFFPLEIMPGAMQAVAQLNPMLHMNQAFKGVAAYGLGVAELRFELAFLVVFSGLSLALGVRSYRHLLVLEQRP